MELFKAQVLEGLEDGEVYISRNAADQVISGAAIVFGPGKRLKYVTRAMFTVPRLNRLLIPILPQRSKRHMASYGIQTPRERKTMVQTSLLFLLFLYIH